MSGRSEVVKRVVDLLGAFVLLVAAAPVMVVLAFLVRMYVGTPVLFTQRRPGRGGRAFDLIKFRSMTDERDANGHLAPDSQRLTPFGRWLRATSLDELPEVWNVLRGDMSLVGPRPLLMRYLDLYSTEQARRHEVRPGITGWAQINGRNGIDWETKFEMDVWYVDNWSVWLDVKILAFTLVKVVRREGIAATGEATMSEFNGSVDRIDGDMTSSRGAV